MRVSSGRAPVLGLSCLEDKMDRPDGELMEDRERGGGMGTFWGLGLIWGDSCQELDC